MGLGLLRTAHARWAATPRDSAAGKALIAYSAGVLEKTGDWPTIYGLTGVRPRPWTPTNTLVVQGVLTQQTASAPVRLTRGDEDPQAWAGMQKAGQRRSHARHPVVAVQDR